MPNPPSDDYMKVLLAGARAAFSTYLKYRYQLRGLGVTEATLATLEAGEHHAYDLLNLQVADLSGNPLGPEY